MNKKPLDFERVPLAYDGKKEGRMTRWVTQLFRAKVPGGWLIATCGSDGLSGITFYPDPGHEWDGGSLGEVPPRPRPG